MFSQGIINNMNDNDHDKKIKARTAASDGAAATAVAGDSSTGNTAVTVPEDIVFTELEQQSYNSTWTLLNQATNTFFAPFPSLVNTDEIIFHNTNTDTNTTLLSSDSNHHQHQQKKKKAKQVFTSSSSTTTTSTAVPPASTFQTTNVSTDHYNNSNYNNNATPAATSISATNNVTGTSSINDGIRLTSDLPTIVAPITATIGPVSDTVPIPMHVSTIGTTLDEIDFDDDYTSGNIEPVHSSTTTGSTSNIVSLVLPPSASTGRVTTNTESTTITYASLIGIDSMNDDTNNDTNSSTIQPPTMSIEATIASADNFVTMLDSNSTSTGSNTNTNTPRRQQYASGRRHAISISNNRQQQQQQQLFPSILINVHDNNDTINATTMNVSLATPGRGQNELEIALKKLEQIEKDTNNNATNDSSSSTTSSSQLLYQCDLTRQLTELITGNQYLSSNDAIQQLELLGKTVPRRVCQHPFKKNDIVWVCRTCQADETCVLCHSCFSQSNHEGHDVAFYHAQAGGCCDCGDPDAWDPNGFCPHHGPTSITSTNPTCTVASLPKELVQRVRGIVPACIDWMVQTVAMNSEIAYNRTNPPKPKKMHKKSKSTTSKKKSISDIAIGYASDSVIGQQNLHQHQPPQQPIAAQRRHQSASAISTVQPLSMTEELVQLHATTASTLRDLLDDNITSTRTAAATSNADGINNQHTSLLPNLEIPYRTRTSSLVNEMMDFDTDQNNTNNNTTSTNIDAYVFNADNDDNNNNSNGGDNDDVYIYEDDNIDADDISLDLYPSMLHHAYDSNESINLDYANILEGTNATTTTTTTTTGNNIAAAVPSTRLASILSPTRQRFSPPASFEFGSSSGGGGELRSMSSSPVTSLNDAPTYNKTDTTAQQELALQLGIEGSKGRGLFLALHADEIHTKEKLTNILREFFTNTTHVADELLTTLVSKLVVALRQYGQLVIWGTRELVTQVDVPTAQAWLEVDDIHTEKHTDACIRVGSVLLDRSNRLSQHGLFCSILTRNELILEQRGVAILQWLSCVARSCDPLCLTVAETILPNRHLVPLLRADFKMSARVTKAWYSLLLTLLAVPTFKSHLAAAYCDTYRYVTAKYARGMGVLERSGFTLSVQFLNRVTYVIDLVQKRDLLGKLGKALLETLMVACDRRSVNGRLKPDHFVLSHRRYSPCVSDLKCVLNVKGMPRVIASRGGTFLADWISALSVAQFMDSQTWRSWNQIPEYDEYRGWIGAFNASISLGSLFERLLGWEDDEKSPINDPSSPLARDLMSSVELTQFVLTTGVERWQSAEKSLFYSIPQYAPVTDLNYKCSPVSLPFSTVASAHGTALAMRQLRISQITPFSFHLPLHRFVASCLRELCLRKDSNKGGIGDLLHRLRTQLDDRRYDELFHGLMEFSVLVLSRASQIRAELWKRNGQGLSDQVLNYAEPPFCRNMRDADMLLTQFSTVGRIQNQCNNVQSSDSGIAFLSNLLLHRLGIFDFTGMTKAPDLDVTRYKEEVSCGLYPGEWTNSDGHQELPWTYSVSRNTATSVVLVEEFLYFMIIFVTELPTVVPQTREDQTKQARFRLFREVVHRLASGSKTHSELSEVHHVLSHWDNVLLSEEGKLLNPDDATGAALASVLSDIAERKVSRGKMEPDKWEMKVTAWDHYDPAFYHISLRCHQSAAEFRPKSVPDAASSFGWKAKPLAPEPAIAHPFFKRLRRDVTADISVLAVTFRVLYKHVSMTNAQKNPNAKAPFQVETASDKKERYEESKQRSETALARAIHIITLGAYAWSDATSDNVNWRSDGGASPGSLFYYRSDDAGSATADSWISDFLLAKPSVLYKCQEYDDTENALLLLQRLAVDGGIPGKFVVQDKSLQACAAWLCEFALTNCNQTSQILTTVQTEMSRTEMERKKKSAKEAALAKIQAQAAKFASFMEVDLGESEDEDVSQSVEVPSQAAPVRKFSFGSVQSSLSGGNTVRASGSESPMTEVSMVDATADIGKVAPRLLSKRPRCIICNDEDASDGRFSERGDEEDGVGQRKRKVENALAFVGYAQASTVLKGGGGPPPDPTSPTSPAREFVGVHIALCGHAVHSECCDSYLASVSRKEDRNSSKREEFRCPLCQRLSNTLVPFIDVGVDWIDSPTCVLARDSKEKEELKSSDSMECKSTHGTAVVPQQLCGFLETSPWWVTRHNSNVLWDGHSAFVEKVQLEATDLEDTFARKQNRRIRTLKKKDLYAAWNAMMRTPRLSIVRRGLRRSLSRSNSRASSPRKEISFSAALVSETSSGETVVWKRFMDLISETSYRADSKRLEDEHLHDLFGEFRHYIVEKYVYNTTTKMSGGEPTDWPTCLFNQSVPDTKRQEMSREKLFSKLLLSIQAFTYSCCCEAFEARRSFRRITYLSSRATKSSQDFTYSSVMSRFGIANVVCDGKLIHMPIPSVDEEKSSPFDGRLGKLRYLALTVMAAAGAVAADLVQLTLPFPSAVRLVDSDISEHPTPLRAPVAYPILLGHVLTHVVAAMCASCGLARARNDSLEVIWPVTFSARGTLVSNKESDNKIDAVLEDCEGFLKLGLLARLLQSLLGTLYLKLDSSGINQTLSSFQNVLHSEAVAIPLHELSWITWCISLLKIACSSADTMSMEADSNSAVLSELSIYALRESCSLAASAGCAFVADAWVIMQILMPGLATKIQSNNYTKSQSDDESAPHEELARLLNYLRLESLNDILNSVVISDVVSDWYKSATQHTKFDSKKGADTVSEWFKSEKKHAKEATDRKPRGSAIEASLQSMLFRTQGFRVVDWPNTGSAEDPRSKVPKLGKQESFKIVSTEEWPQDDAMQIENISDANGERPSISDTLRSEISRPVLTFSTKKTVPLIGGYPRELVSTKSGKGCPCVVSMPTSYTDLYATLCSLMPDCEQTAVCLVCGEVLNASGKGECTNHTNRCGAGAGMFFLLQECTGLIMHQKKAAYIHSPYVDSHGETPQYRGRPLNLDLERYEHLREIWYTHSVRQKVIAERGSSRQVIQIDFY